MDHVLKKPDGSDWYAETINWMDSDPHSTLRIGVSKERFLDRVRRGLTWEIGQMYGVMETGIILVEHVFQGLGRPMTVNGDPDADQSRLVFTWAAHRDAEIDRDGSLTFHAAPMKSVFFVIVSPNTELVAHPGIYGWAERWGWLDAHATVKGAPVNFESRYDTRLWSRE